MNNTARTIGLILALTIGIAIGMIAPGWWGPEAQPALEQTHP